MVNDSWAAQRRNEIPCAGPAEIGSGRGIELGGQAIAEVFCVVFGGHSGQAPSEGGKQGAGKACREEGEAAEPQVAGKAGHPAEPGQNRIECEPDDERIDEGCQGCEDDTGEGKPENQLHACNKMT